VLRINRSVIIIFLVVFILLLIVVIGNIFDSFSNSKTSQAFVCGDGSFYDSCSLKSPFFCEDGKLVEKASICGCVDGLKKNGDSCISEYHVGEKIISLKYLLDGEEDYINFTVYKGLTDYLSSLPSSISYFGEERLFRVDFKFKRINEQKQREFLLPLVSEIQNRAFDKEDQFRIAVSLVQNIPFGFSGKNISVLNGEIVNYSKYPYEVLYDYRGVCGEKSELLAFLLREIGYKIVLFYYPLENHEALGVGCPLRASGDGSDYCFIEASGPSIVTDNEIEYVGGIKLKSNPEVMMISEGISLSKNLQEYDDAYEFKKLRSILERGARLDSSEDKKLRDLKNKYGLIEFYGLD